MINLSSSTTPMALEQPRSPELERFTFFVSRRREEGRERFRLHMGYFDSIADAEDWLSIVRDVYPAAWVGEAPGKRLQAARNQTSSAGPASTETAAAAPPTTRMAPAAPASAATLPAPTELSTPAATTVPPVAVRAPEQLPEPRRADEGRPAASVAVEARSTPRTAKKPAVVPTLKPLNSPQQSNVREVLAQLGAEPDATLSDTQVLKLLEQRGSDAARPKARENAAALREAAAISMLRPDDTQTMRALRQQVAQNEQVSFAVQLAWSVQPISPDQVPPLAIFSAYTLYTVEGSREGRRWYGLRLGFFSDAISAKQVAFYVRSEFTSVAVIPVTARERERAGDPGRARATPPQAARQEAKGSVLAAEEFTLFDDARKPAPAPSVAVAAATSPAASAAGSAEAANSRPAATQVPAPAPARKQRPGRRASPDTLDETLEILGASELQIDTSYTLLNDSGVRHLRIDLDKRQPSAFSRLLDRLTDRMRQS